MAKQVNDDYPGKNKPMSDEQLKAIATANYHSKGPNESDNDNTSKQETETQVFQFPTEIIELPSKGIVYPKSNPLSTGKVEMKYMTAREEDIITNQNYINKNLVVDKLLQSLIVSDVDYQDLIIGDKNALLISARVLGYGKDYKFMFAGEDYSVDLSTLENKEIDESLFTPELNHFSFTLPSSGTEVTFKLMTERTEKMIEQELKDLKKINKELVPEMSTRMKHIITSVNGDDSKKTVRDFVDNYLLARDSKALRDHINNFQPDVNFKFEYENMDGDIEMIDIPISSNFFFPDAV